jgi:hypothetical protein
MKLVFIGASHWHLSLTSILHLKCRARRWSASVIPIQA